MHQIYSFGVTSKNEMWGLLINSTSLRANTKHYTNSSFVSDHGTGCHSPGGVSEHLLSNLHPWRSEHPHPKAKVVLVAHEYTVLPGKISFLASEVSFRYPNNETVLLRTQLLPSLQVICGFVSSRMIYLLTQSYLPLYLLNTLKMDRVSCDNIIGHFWMHNSYYTIDWLVGHVYTYV